MKRRFFGFWKHYYTINKGILFVIVLLILVSLFPWEGKFKYEFQRGKPWQHEDLMAPFNFAILKSSADIQREQREALADAYLFFRFDKDIVRNVKEQFSVRFEAAWKQQKGEISGMATREQKNLLIGNVLIDSIYKRGILEGSPEVENNQADTRIAEVRDNVAEIHDLQ